jgi:hypothetical protein
MLHTMIYGSAPCIPDSILASGNVDALGNKEQEQAGDHSEGDLFNATYSISGFPEYYWGAIQTESLVRDAGPWEAGPSVGNYIGPDCHGRYCRGKDLPTPLWCTEVNMGPAQTYSWGRTDGKQISDEAALAMKAKILPRFLTFFPHKGVVSHLFTCTSKTQPVQSIFS